MTAFEKQIGRWLYETRELYTIAEQAIEAAYQDPIGVAKLRQLVAAVRLAESAVRTAVRNV